MDMDSCFGEYITQQYSLLKEILSNLQPCDLRNARLVCRDWNNAVNRLLDRTPKVFSCFLDEKGEISNIPKSVLPDLIIYHNVVCARPNVNSKYKRCENCDLKLLVCPCKISGPGSIFISLLTHWGTSEKIATSKCHWKSPLVLMLSSSPLVKISTFFLELKTIDLLDKPVTDEDVNQCIGGEEPIKAIIIISFVSATADNHDWINLFLNRISERQGLTFAVGGGVCGNVSYKKGFTPKHGQSKRINICELLQRRGVVFITFRGDGVRAQSELICTRELNLTEKLNCEIGSETQIAFIADNRRHFVRSGIHPGGVNSMWCYFDKHLPNIPKCGFQTWNIYGIRSSSRDPELNEISKRGRLSFDDEDATSLLLLTFKNF